MSGGEFYCRYYVGHKGKFGHEFMEFEITSDGKLRYANNSNYKNDFMIRKEGKPSVILIFPDTDFYVYLSDSWTISY
jgi:hypothetical protein